jgi:ABC-2 type transport system ATP-binding protein
MAMLHRPPLLILDEPTVGADIRTRQEILDAVRKLADEGHAICYSTHYLPEIEQLGASVALLQGGEIIARGSIAELVREFSKQAVELTFEGPAPDIAVRGAETTLEGSRLRITTDSAAETAAAVLAQLGANAIRLRNVELVRPSLDAIYLTLTEQRYSHEQPVSSDDTQGGEPSSPRPRSALQNSGVNFKRP